MMFFVAHCPRTRTGRIYILIIRVCMYVSDNSSCWLIPFTGFSLININPITCGMEFGVNVQGEGGNYTKKVNSEVNALGNK